jgi:hypothetical protein
MPKHIWLNNVTGELRTIDDPRQLITSGPYMYSEALRDHTYAIAANLMYHFRADRNWEPPNPIYAALSVTGFSLAIVVVSVIVTEVLMRKAKKYGS